LRRAIGQSCRLAAILAADTVIYLRLMTTEAACLDARLRLRV
jgi:hypothetical protein